MRRNLNEGIRLKEAARQRNKSILSGCPRRRNRNDRGTAADRSVLRTFSANHL